MDFNKLVEVNTDDPGIAARGRAFNILLIWFFIALVCVSIILVIHYFLVPDSSYGFPTLINGLLVSSVIISSYLLSFKGRVNLGVHLFLFGLLLGTSTAILVRGSGNAIILIFPIVIITAGLILGPRSAFAYSILSVAFYAMATYILQLNGTILAEDVNTLTLNNYMAVIASMFVVAIVTWLFTSNLQKHLHDLERSGREKELLLKEVHHRVKNNLQIISSMLNLQMDGMEDEKSKHAMKESIGRVRSMALIHERLYMSSDLSSINISDYVSNLLDHIGQSQAANVPDLEIEQEIKEIYLDVDVSLSLGLIINELVTNSLKHGFPTGSGPKSPMITVSIKESGEYLLLKVADNGVGFSSSVDINDSDTLGLQLVSTLAHELDGEMEMKRENGTVFLLKFKHRRQD